MLALGFVFGIVLGVLFFELFSVKRARTYEDAEALLAMRPTGELTPDYSDSPQEVERWK